MRRSLAVSVLAGCLNPVVVLVGAALLPLGAAPVPITVCPAERHQTIEGFGCSISAWFAPMYRVFYDEKFVDYAANELGQSVFRMQLWGGVSPKEIVNWPEISYEKFDWTTDGLRGKANLDFARNLVAANPEVRIIGTVWSAPAWMKQNGSRTGSKAGGLVGAKRDYDVDNRLRDDRYQHFAKWIVEWARLMEAQGTPFYALSLQNELMFSQWFESTLYTAEEYARVVRVTGEMFETEGVRKPLFFGPEDMTMATYRDERRHRPYVDALMQPEVAKYFDVFATHGYSDGIRSDERNTPVAYAESVAQFHRPYWITEGGTGPHDWPLPITRGIAPRLHIALTQADVSLICGWQLTSQPGKASDGTFMDWDQPTAKTYATMHYWRHIRPGAVRVGVLDPGVDGLLVSAFVHEGRGETVMVLINQSEETREVVIDWAGASTGDWRTYQTTATKSHASVADFRVEDGRPTLLLPGPSITTLVSGLTATRTQLSGTPTEKPL